jgi:anti-sigma-K factor RskA
VWHPDDESLAGVALGVPDDDTLSAQAHLRECERCAAVVAAYRDTAALVGAVGVARAADGPAEVRWEAPPAAVWARIEAELDAPGSWSEDSGGPHGVPAPAPGVAGVHGIPDLATVPSLADHRERRETGARGDRRTHRTEGGRRSRPRWLTAAPYAAGAAAAGVAIGLLAGHGVWGSEPAAPSPTTLMSAPLDTLDTGQRQGEAMVVKQAGSLGLTLDTASLTPADDGYLEVWLINTDGKRMVSVGVLQPGATTATFPVPQELMDQGYRIVDISREPFDDSPEHSGDSLLRGELSAV